MLQRRSARKTDPVRTAAAALALVAALALLPAGTLPSSSVGPADPEDVQLLWKEGRLAFGRGDYEKAEWNYARITDRHPGSRNYLEAHLLLGLTRLRLGRPGKAVDPLKHYITASGETAEGYRARISLGRAYLDSGKLHEVLLTAYEVIGARGRDIVPEEVHLESLLLKTWALIRLGQDPKARRSLDSFFTGARKEGGIDALRTEAYRLEIELKVRNCARYSASARLNEGQIRHQLKQRGICLSEALIPFLDALQEGNDRWVTDSRDAVIRAYEEFRRACSNPPPPPTRLSAVEQRRYRSELLGVLQTDCYQARRKALDILDSWKQKIPQGEDRHLEAVSRVLRGGAPGIEYDRPGKDSAG